MYGYLLKPRWDPGLLRQTGNDPVLRHEGNHCQLLERHRQHAALVASGASGIRPIGPLLMRRLADARTMRTAYDRLRRDGGQAAGVNGLHLDDLENGEAWSLCRALASAVRQGSYRPGPERHHAIPKGPGRGERVLAIQNIQDRIVGKAASLILQPVVDRGFHPFSMGFRPHHGPQEALATALALIRLEQRHVWVSEDVATAFDAVPHSRFLDACRKWFPADVVSFIDLISNIGKKRGLRQGSPASPLFWNSFADRYIDRPYQQAAAPGTLIRYADDLLLLCRSVPEAQEARDRLARIARAAGTPLKAADGSTVVDLSIGQPVVWLGYRLIRDGRRLSVRIAPRAWEKLAQDLAEAHLTSAAPLRAIDIIHGWLGYLGPCYTYEPRSNVLERLRDLAGDAGFDELPCGAELQAYWQQAYARWQRLRQRESDALPERLKRVQQWITNVRSGDGRPALAQSMG